MPTNLPPECTALEQAYLDAKRPSEKIAALQRYLAAIPKHKGTERLCARLKTKLAKLRLEEATKKGQRGPSYLGSQYAVKKEGAAQMVLVGLTCSGKSSILRTLTNAQPEVYGYPFTTQMPTPGMTAFEDVQIQLVEAPALFEGAGDGSGWGPRVLGLARNGDGLILVVDLSAADPRRHLATLIDELGKSHITVVEQKGKVVIERKESGGIQVVFLTAGRVKTHEVKHLLRQMKLDHVVVKIQGDVELADITQALLYETVYKPTIVLANKMDVEGAAAKLRALRAAFSELPVYAVSAAQGTGFEEIPRRIFEALRIIRVYTKRARLPPSTKPMILKAGSTIGDAAKMIHRDFYADFKYARLWGSSKYPGERVGLHNVLQDKDVLEIRV